MSETVLFWFRRDLRLADNPGLIAALKDGQKVVPVFVHDPDNDKSGGAVRWWLHHSLASLDKSLRKLGSRLILRQGDAAEIIPRLAEDIGAGLVYCNRLEEPWAHKQQERIERRVKLKVHNAALLYPIGSVTTKTGGSFKVFTPFWNACKQEPPPPKPVAAPKDMPPVDGKIASDDLDSFGLLPTKPDWAGGLRDAWEPGEDSALEALETFLEERLDGYDHNRDLPAQDGTSALSPHLRFGEIGPRQIYHAVRGGKGRPTHDAERFLAEIGWREFCYNLLAQFPDLPSKPFRPEYENFPWRRDAKAEKAWEKGETGIPLIDAGLRQLWTTGTMHNRVRMAVASFLVKNLLVPWQHGADWFLDTLVDADLANNSANWQWVAGCGADAAPYFRIFNPVLQGEKFDPHGDYVRHWCPELKKLPDRHVHKPWEAGGPKPIVDLAGSRERALLALKEIRKP